MKESFNRAFYLSIDEFLIILYKNRITGLIFPKEITDTYADGKRLKNAMNSLIISKRLLPVDDKSFEFSDDVITCVATIKEASETLVMYGRTGIGKERFIYVSADRAAVISVDERHGGWFRIEIMMTDTLLEQLDNCGSYTVIKKYRRGENTPYETLRGDSNGIG